LEIVHVYSKGVAMVRDGSVVKEESFLEKSDRQIHLEGRRDEQEPEEDDGEDGKGGEDGEA
ncbi:MAG TPA: hypothetical protein VEX86_10555, partial [Longimicrobium sp.]|nr:hypothetical protein [Longimicrobium sp.]